MMDRVFFAGYCTGLLMALGIIWLGLNAPSVEIIVVGTITLIAAGTTAAMLATRQSSG